MSFNLSDKTKVNVSTSSDLQQEWAVYVFNIRYDTHLHMPICRFKTFVGRMKEIDQVLTDNEHLYYRRHLGGGYHVTVNKRVDIRRFYQSRAGDLRPTGDGLSLKLAEWNELKNIIPQICALIPNYDSILECPDREGQLGFLRCTECNPYDCFSW